MTLLPRIPFVARVPLFAAVLMVVVGVLASQQVLSALNRTQDARIRELATLQIEALSIALGPHVLRNDIWEVYDALTRASYLGDGRRIAFTVVSGQDGRVMASTDPRRAPIDANIDAFAKGAASPEDLTVSIETPLLRLSAPLVYQGRTVGQLVTELDVSDLLAERKSASRFLIFGNAIATFILSLFGYFISNRMLQPLKSLTEHMGASDSALLPFRNDEIPSGDNELSRLFQTFNRMAKAQEEKTEAERRLAERERFVSLGRLSSSLAHEINNPLGGLKNAADTISNYADRPEVVRQSTDILIRGLNHLAEVVKATLDVHRVDRNDTPLVRHDIDDLKILIEPELRRKSQTLLWDCNIQDTGDLGIPAAPVRQVLLNLLLNAIEVAGEKGSVAFQATAQAEDLSFTVTDSGPGLSEEARRRLLSDDPLPLGGGIGLRLVHDLVNDLDGNLFVERVDGMTAIKVSFPRNRRQGTANA